tara:strand:- start:1468 stop:1755 length:288 start_codon:yes stop_codon:yes gene_type:complete
MKPPYVDVKFTSALGRQPREAFMTHLSKITEDTLCEDSAESGAPSTSPVGRWSVLMSGWLSAPRRLSSGDVTALAEVLRRREAVGRWRAPKENAA